MKYELKIPKGVKVDKITTNNNVVIVECITEDTEKDISEIAPNFDKAIEWLMEDLHGARIDTTKKHRDRLDAFNQLIILAEAWNQFDEFEPDYADQNQSKYFPVFVTVRGILTQIIPSHSLITMSPYPTLFAFKSRERAAQFGNQFIDLFRKLFL